MGLTAVLRRNPGGRSILIKSAQALQDQIKVDQPGGAGRFDIPQWDQASLDSIRSSVLSLAATIPVSRGMFGLPAEVDPVRHFIGIANCLPVTPGWNYMVRLYKPRANVLNGSWHFPEATPAD